MPNRANRLMPTVSDNQYLVNVGKFLYQTDMSVILVIACYHVPSSTVQLVGRADTK